MPPNTPSNVPSSMPPAEPASWHLASLVIYCQPPVFLATRRQINDLPYAAVHTDDNHAKLVITIEGETTAQLSEYMEHLRLLPGTLSVQMVFHQQDDNQDDSLDDNLKENIQFYNAAS